MLRRLTIFIIALVVVVAAAGYIVTEPRTVSARDLPQHAGDPTRGAYVFNAAGCASCHAAPDVKDPTAVTELPGGQSLVTPFGTFLVPNISTDKATGIGGWSLVDFVNAVKFGVSPEGEHYYPAFPYPSFQRMTYEDLIDLKAYLDTLPAVSAPDKPHQLPFPANIRRAVGLWKLVYVDGKTFAPDPSKPADVNRGAYLVNGPAHCGECHTPRNAAGGPIADRLLSGAPNLTGKGRIPNITPDKATGIGDWSEDDIVELLTSGTTPDFDTVGGDMAKVVRETAKMTPEDRHAIAAYLKSIPPVSTPRPQKAGGSAGS